jgi:2-keto-3-deoxy-L-rhamnonate aldolase RhmA
MVGTFTKTPSPIVHEVLALSQLDCVCIDAEHAPFGRTEVDAGVAALYAGDMPSLVRLPNHHADTILQALDCGATGVMVPHVSSAATARAIAAASAYGGDGTRGYAGSSRAAGYTRRTMREHIARSNAERVVIAQIEDAAAVAAIDAIAAVPDVDCLFVGRADLTVSMGAAATDAPDVLAAVERVCKSGAKCGKTIGMYCPPTEALDRWIDLGATFFLLSSDQTFLLDGAKALAAQIRS